jgi:D-alanyl-D-alanine carboxypeptidase
MFRPLSASYVVDATVKTVAVGQPSADGNASFALLKDFLTAAKVDVAQLAMSDAEGGPADRATPQTFAQILRSWTRQKDFDAFRACLSIVFN